MLRRLTNQTADLILAVFDMTWWDRRSHCKTCIILL